MSEKYVASRAVPQPRNAMAGRPLTGAKPMNSNPNLMPGQATVGEPRSNSQGPPAGHASQRVLADVSKLSPRLEAGIRRVASSK